VCSGGADPLIALQSSEAKNRYSATWGLMLTFAMRLFKKQQTQARDAPTNLLFPQNQVDWLKAAWSYADKAPNHGSARDVLLGLSTALWSPQTSKHLMNNMFSDAVLQFSVYSNLVPDGSFMDPKVISSSLARIKYIMRVSTLFWLVGVHERTERPMTW
jgi:hypothetical protein